MSESQKGKKHPNRKSPTCKRCCSEDTKQKLSEANKCKKHTEETKSKISINTKAGIKKKRS